MNFLERFYKIHRSFLYKLFSVEVQTEKGTNIMNWISQFRYAITNALHIYSSSAKCLAFLQALEPISLYCLSGQHSYTLRSLCDTSALNSEILRFKFHAESQSFWNSLRYCLVSLLITTLKLTSWYFQFITSSRWHSDIMNTVWIK
jgi:hypothetical protein